MTTLKCSNCGTTLEAGGQYCSVCGRKVHLSEQASGSKKLVYADHIKPKKSYKLPGKKLLALSEVHSLQNGMEKDRRHRKVTYLVMMASIVGVTILYAKGIGMDRHSQELYQVPSAAAKHYYIPGNVLLLVFFVSLVYNLWLRESIRRAVTQLREAGRASEEGMN